LESCIFTAFQELLVFTEKRIDRGRVLRIRDGAESCGKSVQMFTVNARDVPAKAFGELNSCELGVFRS